MADLRGNEIINAYLAGQNLRMATEKRESDLKQQEVENKRQEQLFKLREKELNEALKQTELENRLSKFKITDALKQQIFNEERLPDTGGVGSINPDPLLTNAPRGQVIATPQVGVNTPFDENITLGRDELIRNIAAQRERRQREISEAGQLAEAKEKPRRITQIGRLDVQDVLQQRRDEARQTFDAEQKQLDRENRATIAAENRREATRRALLRGSDTAKNLGNPEKVSQIHDAAEQNYLLRGSEIKVPTADSLAVNSAIKEMGGVWPSKEQAKKFNDILPQFPNLIQRSSELLEILKENPSKNRLLSAISGGVQKATGLSENAQRQRELKTNLISLAKGVAGEAGERFTNEDENRVEPLLIDIALPLSDNLRRVTEMERSMNSFANIALGNLPKKQRQDIFDANGLPFTALTLNEILADPNLPDSLINAAKKKLGSSREQKNLMSFDDAVKAYVEENKAIGVTITEAEARLKLTGALQEK